MGLNEALKSIIGPSRNPNPRPSSNQSLNRPLIVYNEGSVFVQDEDLNFRREEAHVMGYHDYDYEGTQHESKYYRKSKSSSSKYYMNTENKGLAKQDSKRRIIMEETPQVKHNKHEHERVHDRKRKERALEEEPSSEKLSTKFQEQDNMNDHDAAEKHTTKDLAGVKILHGLLEAGSLVLTLKDQTILADGDVNEALDMLENGEIGEQKRRDEAYKAGKRKTCVYDDMFADEYGVEKTMFPQYSCGRFSGEAEKKLEELRQRTLGVSDFSHGENLNSSVRIPTDYLTKEEAMKFKRPAKKKSLRKKEKLDLDALEAEAVFTGLGDGNLGSRNHGRRQNLKAEEDRMDAERRSRAYQSACAKAEKASKALQQESMSTAQTDKDDMLVFGDDDDELRKSLERVRKIALKKQNAEEKSAMNPLHAISTADNHGSGEQHGGAIVITEMEEFFSGLQYDEVTQKPNSADFCTGKDVAPIVLDKEMKDEDGIGAVETVKANAPKKEQDVQDETIHEYAVEKGIAATLQLLRDQGSLSETAELSGRNMDKKSSKLARLSDGYAKEIHIERYDEHGRVLTKKEAFRRESHVFHGKWPGKRKQEKDIKQYDSEQKIKRMNNADTPSRSAQRMREAQARLQTPYLVLSRKS